MAAVLAGKLQGHTDAVLCCEASPSQLQLATGGEVRYDGRLVPLYKEPSAPPPALAFRDPLSSASATYHRTACFACGTCGLTASRGP